MPQTIRTETQRINAKLFQFGSDFDCSEGEQTWRWAAAGIEIRDLPYPALHGSIQIENASTAMMALSALRDRLPLTDDAIRVGLANVKLRGRFDVAKGNRGTISFEWIFDVAHNPAAAEVLARNLKCRNCAGRTIAVCGMFADKDVLGVIKAVSVEVDQWIVAGVEGTRALAPESFAQRIADNGEVVAHVAANVSAACDYAESIIEDGDRIVVFGSFHTVGPALEWFERKTSVQM
jgi:dihydrofolate synthase/folylpolyglutamate synthase